ncbi:uncharacterized protein LOC132054341 [Lycium ferocissimum]|uniref:uncharacterized protein LOC132054341 n=1 Tax=Lycium ferocissimum TaxID=112874 RepID=UPI0028162815|nr:uncharacterized protein LOC132054341 [Lycium ferocissimum]
MIDPVMDPEASAQRITRVATKKTKKKKSSDSSTKKQVVVSTAPTTSLPLKRKKSSEEGSSSRSNAENEDRGASNFPIPSAPETVILDDDKATEKDYIVFTRTRSGTVPETRPATPLSTQNLMGMTLITSFLKPMPPLVVTFFSNSPQAESSRPSQPRIPMRLSSPRWAACPLRNHASSLDRLVDVYPAPSVNSNQVRTITISITEDTNFIFRPVSVANYLRPQISKLDKKKMREVSWKCLINEGMHATGWVRFLIGKGLRLCIDDFDKLNAHLGDKDRELEFYKSELSRRYSQLSGDLPVLKAELEQVKKDLQQAN